MPAKGAESRACVEICLLYSAPGICTSVMSAMCVYVAGSRFSFLNAGRISTYIEGKR